MLYKIGKHKEIFQKFLVQSSVDNESLVEQKTTY